MTDTATTPPHSQSIKAVRAADYDGQAYWFCAYSGSRIQVLKGGVYYCSGCHGTASRIVKVRSFR